LETYEYGVVFSNRYSERIKMFERVKLIIGLIFTSANVGAEIYPYEQKMIGAIKNDSTMIEALVNECIEYCKIENASIYEVVDPKKCDYRGWIGYRNYYCGERGKNETIMIRYYVKDRFGRNRVDDKVCAWFGNEYKIKSTCIPNSLN